MASSSTRINTSHPVRPAPFLRSTTDSSRDTTATDDGDQPFVTAFTRSPPSFDKFDSKILSDDGGIFPQATPHSAGSPNTSLFSHHSYSSVGPSHSYQSEGEPRSVGPHGITWGDSSVVNHGRNEGEGHIDDNGSLNGSADPPAILLLDDEEDWNDDDEQQAAVGAPVGQVNMMGNAGHPATAGPWFDNTFTDSQWNTNQDEPRNKNRRLVSPSPSPLKEAPSKKKLNGASNDEDFAAWGGAMEEKSNGPTKKEGSENDVFGSNFFSTGFGNDQSGNLGFDSVNDNGFDIADVEDAFFGNSWMEMKAGHNTKNANDTNTKGSATKTNDSDAWGGNTSFNSNEESNTKREDVPLSEEKKDDSDTLPQIHSSQKGDNSAQQMETRETKVWNDGRGTTKDVALSSSNPTKQHPLKVPSQQSQRMEKQVVVTFDKGLPSSHRPPHIMFDDRKVSHGSNAVASASPRSHHRRLPSNGSQQSSSRRNKKSGGSVTSAHSRRSHRKGGGGGGSVGSNSSAVDQILEHYRQKRRMASKNNTSSGTISTRTSTTMASGSSSVHSGAHLGSQASVNSGSQVSNAASSSVAGGGVSSIGNGSAAAAAAAPAVGAMVKGISPGSGQASGGVSVSSRSHRRNPSSDSVSQIIENLENAATAVAAGKSKAANTNRLRAASPAMGKYYPPNANGYVGGNGGDDAADRFLLANIEATIGPRGVAPDMESLSGRSVRSHISQSRQARARSSSRSRPRGGGSRPHRSPTRLNMSSDASVNSRTSRTSRASRASRNSFRTYQSTRSALTAMSKETQSVANDLFRLEAQLAEQVARQQEQEEGHLQTKPPLAVENISYSTSGEHNNNSNSNLGATPVPRGPAPFQITAPPGKLGILLSNKSGQKGPTHVSAVRSESVLAGKVHVGDVFMSIDGEDVTRMNSKEITNIMARKAEFERVLRFRPLVTGNPQRQEWI
eukprot:CAMPEP_0183715336 /NCGR_PEP_ID=MMETSP0737-20130205/9599_1 /TAXON_ID=385413 /ORGANISM="Thalassiosira miniscula, Strain CCMP1093" /LENGTH=953 /DNA_ID=CAMNT_0025944427 /DNA_START=547 /DNA_END=3408 /DNA_ORIENTATION=+